MREHRLAPRQLRTGGMSRDSSCRPSLDWTAQLTNSSFTFVLAKSRTNNPLLVGMRNVGFDSPFLPSSSIGKCEGGGRLHTIEVYAVAGSFALRKVSIHQRRWRGWTFARRLGQWPHGLRFVVELHGFLEGRSLPMDNSSVGASEGRSLVGQIHVRVGAGVGRTVLKIETTELRLRIFNFYSCFTRLESGGTYFLQEYLQVFDTTQMQIRLDARGHQPNEKKVNSPLCLVGAASRCRRFCLLVPLYSPLQN